MRITEYYLLIPFASKLVSQHTITCDPHEVQFSDPTSAKLRVDLKPINIPNMKDVDYSVIAYSKTDGENIKKYTLNMGSKCKPNHNFTLEKNLIKDWDNHYIAYCLYDEKKFCDLGKDKLYDVILLKYIEEQTSSSDCIMPNKCELTLDVGNYCNNFTRTVPTPTQRQENKDVPELSVNRLESGEYESRVDIICSAVGQKFDLLSLYQNRAKEKRPVLLNIVQYLKDEEGEITLALHKNLTVYDKDSTIYCVKQKPDNLSYERKSPMEMLRVGDYKYAIYQPLVTRITVEPDNDTAEFSHGKPLMIACRGTALIQDRSLTWYTRDPNTSELEVPDASSQQYNQTTNENVLTLWLTGSYDSKTLFCAQDSHLLVEHASGRRTVVRYGEEATSRNITLKLQKEIDVAPTGSGPDLRLVCGVVAGIAALLVVAALAAWWLRKRKTGEGEPEENQYATIAEVTYAELALKESAGAPKTQDSSPYAQIVGVYNPRK